MQETVEKAIDGNMHLLKFPENWSLEQKYEKIIALQAE